MSRNGQNRNFLVSTCSGQYWQQNEGGQKFLKNSCYAWQDGFYGNGRFQQIDIFALKSLSLR